MRALAATVWANGSRVHESDGLRRPVAYEPKLLVDKIPDRDDLRFQTKPSGRGTVYFAELGGYASYVWHDPRDQAGFAGGHVKGRLAGGGEFDVKGPWSGSPASMLKAGFPATISVSLTDEPDVWERGYTFWGSSVTADWFTSEALPLLPGFTLEWLEHFAGSDSADHHQSRFIGHGVEGVETIAVPQLAPRYLVRCSDCRGRGNHITDEPCPHSLCKGKGVIWPDTEHEKVCSLCKGDGKKRRVCETCNGNGIDLDSMLGAVT